MRPNQPSATGRPAVLGARERHRPPHKVARGLAVFVTASTYRHVRHLESEARRDQFQALLLDLADEHSLDPIAWVILADHYHVVLKRPEEDAFSAWISNLHGRTSHAWNREEGVEGRLVWYEYWDTTLWSEGDLWTRINYIHNNPRKHGYTEEPQHWRWSSLSVRAAAWREPETASFLERFPAPRQIPRDRY